MSSEPSWVRHAVWWRLMPLGFTGCFPHPATGPTRPDEHRLLRIVPWLDHAVELGASGVALGPVFASSSHGYDTVDHLRLDPRLGEEADFDTLVAEAHARGLRVQLDGVFNHIGREHPLAVAALRDGPQSEAGRWLRSAGEGFVPFEGHEILLTLNHDDPRVRQLVVDVMRHWLDRGADAWRLDAAYAVPTDFWAAVLPEVRSTHPDAWCEGEVIHGDYAGFVAASTVDAVTQYELWKAIWSSINDGNLHELAWALQRHDAMLETFAPTTFIGNHDVTRIASRITDPRHLPHAVVLLALLGGTPSVYAGDEFGLRGVKQEQVGGDDAIRPEFPADVSGLALDDRAVGLLHLHQLLIGVRRRHPWLHRAVSRTLGLDNTRLTLELAAEEQALIVTLNLGDAPVASPSGDPLAEDEHSRSTPGSVAPHGWCVVRP